VALEPAQLEAAWLTSVDFELDPDFDRDDISAMTYSVESEAHIGDRDDHEDGSLASMVKLDLVVKWSRHDEETSDDAPVPFRIAVQVTGVFEWPAGRQPEERLARLWLEYNGMYLLWPYARSYIAQISGMSNLPALTLYTMSVPVAPDLTDDVDTSEVTPAEPSADREPH
jgi:hypothetical protein